MAGESTEDDDTEKRLPEVFTCVKTDKAFKVQVNFEIYTSTAVLCPTCD